MIGLKRSRSMIGTHGKKYRIAAQEARYIPYFSYAYITPVVYRYSIVVT